MIDIEVLQEDIEMVINDTHDIDARDEHYARNIVSYLKKHGYLIRFSDKVDAIRKCLVDQERIGNDYEAGFDDGISRALEILTSEQGETNDQD